MKPIRTNLALFAALIAIVAVAGCGPTGATPPQPMAEGDVKAAVDKASPQEQIDWINRSPMPVEEKQRRIAEIEQKYGVKAGGVSSAPGAPPEAAAAAPAPGTGAGDHN